MKEAFFDTPLCREFAWLDEFSRLPDESTVLRFRRRLEKYKLTEQIMATANGRRQRVAELARFAAEDRHSLERHVDAHNHAAWQGDTGLWGRDAIKALTRERMLWRM